jgi:hypothetical protein
MSRQDAALVARLAFDQSDDFPDLKVRRLRGNAMVDQRRFASKV